MLNVYKLMIYREKASPFTPIVCVSGKNRHDN